MKLLDKFKKPATKKIVVGRSLINQEDISKSKLAKFHGKNLLEIDELESKLIDVRKMSIKLKNGDVAQGIGLEFPNEKVFIGLSRNFDHEVFDNDQWVLSTLYCNRTRLEGEDAESASGPWTYSFGMPGVVNVEVDESLAKEEELQEEHQD